MLCQAINSILRNKQYKEFESVQGQGITTKNVLLVELIFFNFPVHRIKLGRLVQKWN